jgi:hypothetical protein
VKKTTHTVEALDAPAPDGGPAVKISCNCEICPAVGIAAVVRKAYADEHNLAAQTAQAYTEVHNLIHMANSPLRRAPQIMANGPWPASAVPEA